MEIFGHDLENINDLLDRISRLSEHYEKNIDHDDKTHQQPVLFNKPKNIEIWKNFGLPKINGFHILDYEYLKANYGVFDTDIIWYIVYVLAYAHKLVLHDVLDWQLVAISTSNESPENKIYVNINKDSDIFGFYVYAPGSDENEVFDYDIIATNNEQFEKFWIELGKCKCDDSNRGGRDKPMKIIKKNKKRCFLNGYYTCPEDECIIKKKKVCNLLGIKYSDDIKLAVKKCGVCYWIRVEKGNQVLLAGDLFYDINMDKFVSKGKSSGFLKWEDSFDKITTVLNIKI